MKETRNIKPLAIGLGILIVLVSLFLLPKAGNKEAVSPESSASSLSDEPKGSDPVSQLTAEQPGTETAAKEHGESSVVLRGSASTSTSAGSDWYKGFSTALSQNVIAQGMSQEVADCLLSASQDNQKNEKPLDFDEISDSCALKYQLSTSQRDGLRKSFRDSVSEGRVTVDIDKWKACMLEKYKGGGCIPGLIRANVESFYTQKSGSAPMRSDDFERDRQAEIEKILNEALQKCPNNLDELSGVFANECT